MANGTARRIIVIGLFAVLAGVGGYVWLRPAPAAPIVGIVRATEIRVAPEVGGQLATIKVHKGDSVRAGDVVAELSALELTASVGQARAALAAAVASRDHVYAGVRAEQIAGLAAEIAKAKSRLLYAEAQLSRTSTLARSDTASQQELDQTTNDAAAARADVAEAEANHAAAVVGPTREERAIADAQVQAAAAALAVLERRLGQDRPAGAGRWRGHRHRCRSRGEHQCRPAGACDPGERQAMAVIQRAGGFPARPHGGDQGRRLATRRAANDPGHRHGAAGARAIRDLAGRTRGRRLRSQHAASTH